MTVRRFNYTGRRRINNLRIRIDKDVCNIKELHIPNDALSMFSPEDIVWLEARRPGGLDIVRYNLGTVAAPSSANGLDFSMLNCSVPAFIVKVVDGRQPGGRIAGISSDIEIESGDSPCGKSLLGLTVDQDLKDRAWRLDFGPGNSGPVLVVSGAIPDAHDFAGSKIFTALVLPEVLKMVLIKILHSEGIFEIGNGEDWQSKWLTAMCRIRIDGSLPEEPEAEDDQAGWQEVDEWIEECISCFEEKTGILKQLVAELRETEVAQ